MFTVTRQLKELNCWTAFHLMHWPRNPYHVGVIKEGMLN